MSTDLDTSSGPKGAMHADSPWYVKRRADDELVEGLLRGEFCYVLTSRQMGKSSLMARAAKHLRGLGVNVIVLDLQALGTNITLEQWYFGLANYIGRLLRMEDEVDDLWLSQTRFSPVQRLRSAFHDIILPTLRIRSAQCADAAPSGQAAAAAGALGANLVIFIDEIDVVRSLPFGTDDFFAAINEFYNWRGQDPDFERLAFCLLGVATPSELMRDLRRTPFNIGRRIELTDFAPEDVGPLAYGWNDPVTQVSGSAREVGPLLERVLYWTHGHPYLSQRLARAVGSNPPLREASEVDSLCAQLFCGHRTREEDDNLLFVRDRILRTDYSVRDVLKLYRRIWQGERVEDDETNRLIDTLRLAGIVRVENGCLVVRNRIYHRVFDDQWITANLPPERQADPSSIAVLAFRIVGPDLSDEYLADGLTDELIGALGRVAGLRVASRTSAFQFKGKSEDVRKIGAQLVVQNLLEGSLRQVGKDIQISAQLVRVSDGTCAWSESYRHSQKDLAEVLDKIAAAIVSKLPAQLRYKPRSLPTIRPQDNSGAYNLYLKGRFYWNRRTESAVRRSIELFQEAIQMDPGCALAHAGLADALNILATYNYARPLDSYPKAKAAATRALELDDDLAQAHCALACSHAVLDWNWERAEAEFRRAIELNPNYAAAHQWYAINCLSPLGRHDEALLELQQAQEADPLSISITTSIGLALYLAGRFGEAIAQCREAVEMDPSFWLGQLFLGWACIQKQQFNEAEQALQSSLACGNKDPVALAALAHAYAIMGRGAEALNLLKELQTMSESRYVPVMDIVPVHLALGDEAAALAALDQAYTERSFKLIYLKVDPRLRQLQVHPRVVALARQVGLEKADA